MDDFFGTVSDVVHSGNPQHLVFDFQPFIYAFGFCHLFNESVKPFRCLFIHIGKVTVQFASENESVVECRAMLFEIGESFSAPHSDGTFVGFGKSYVRDIIITDECVWRLNDIQS